MSVVWQILQTLQTAYLQYNQYKLSKATLTLTLPSAQCIYPLHTHTLTGSSAMGQNKEHIRVPSRPEMGGRK